MNFDDYLNTLRVEGELYVAALATTDPQAPVPTCPEWTARELTLHVGEVHRWARFMIENPGSRPPADIAGPAPGDAHLASWLAEGHIAVVQALEAANPDGAFYTFLADPPSPRTFWARRQAHETAMHRVDLQSANGQITPFTSQVAADGIDEMLTGFIPRKHMKLRSERPQTLLVAPHDCDERWLVSISANAAITARTGGAADCTLGGSAADILCALWNRPTAGQLDVAGDGSVVALFTDSVQIRWG